MLKGPEIAYRSVILLIENIIDKKNRFPFNKEGPMHNNYGHFLLPE